MVDVGGRGRTGRNGALPTTSGEPVRSPLLAIRGVLLFMAAAFLLGVVEASWITAPAQPPPLKELH
jgi:hypothetical protein